MASCFGAGCGGEYALWLVQARKKKKEELCFSSLLLGLTGCKAFPGSTLESAGGATLLKSSKNVSDLPEPAACWCKILINLHYCCESMMIHGIQRFMRYSVCNYVIANSKKIQRFQLSGCNVWIPQPDGSWFADRPLQGAVSAFADKPIYVVDSAFRSGYFDLGGLSTFDTGMNDREIFFVHAGNIIFLLPVVKRD